MPCTEGDSLPSEPPGKPLTLLELKQIKHTNLSLDSFEGMIILKGNSSPNLLQTPRESSNSSHDV